MRVLMIAVAVFGLSTIGIALAQQAGGPPKPQANDKARLRAELVKLRVEVELLQLEHAVEAEHLKSAMAEMKALEGFLDGGPPGLLADYVKKLNESSGGYSPAGILVDALKAPREEARRYVERKRKDFVRQAAELAGKRLDLEDLEKQYRDAR